MSLELELLKLNAAVKNLIKVSDDSKKELKRRAQIPFEKLKEHYEHSASKFLDENQDADMIDYINDHIQKSKKIISEVKRLDLQVKPYSREKYIRFLNQELEFEKAQIEKISQFNIIDSNRPRIEVIYFMFTLKEMGIFKFDNDSILSKFIDRHCRYDKGKKIKNSRQTISNIRKGIVNVEKYKIKFQEFLKSQDL
jgi:hypothetical protein